MVSLSTALVGALGLGVSAQAGSTIAASKSNRVYRVLKNWETPVCVVAGIILAAQGAQIVGECFGLTKFAFMSTTHSFWACGGIAAAIFFGYQFAKWSSEELHERTKPQVILKGAFEGAEFEAAPFQKNMEMWAIGQLVCSVALLALSINPYFQVINIALQLTAIASMVQKKFVQLNHFNREQFWVENAGHCSNLQIKYYVQVFIAAPTQLPEETGSSMALGQAIEDPVSSIQICPDAEHQSTISEIGKQMTQRLRALEKSVKEQTILSVTPNYDRNGRYIGDTTSLTTQVSRNAVLAQCKVTSCCHPTLMEATANVDLKYNAGRGIKLIPGKSCILSYREDLPLTH